MPEPEEALTLSQPLAILSAIPAGESLPEEGQDFAGFIEALDSTTQPAIENGLYVVVREEGEGDGLEGYVTPLVVGLQQAR
jgi:hypothetical protein